MSLCKYVWHDRLWPFQQKKISLINLLFSVEDKIFMFSISSRGLLQRTQLCKGPLYLMPYFLVSKYINEERVLDIWTVLTSVDPYWSKVLYDSLFLPSPFELLFASVAQWDSWVSWLANGFSCFREWLLTLSPGSAVKSDSSDTGFSSLGSAPVVLNSFCQCFVSTG